MGHAAMIRGVVEMMAQAKGTLPVVVLTGGLSRIVREILPRGYIVDEDLILKGLSIIFTLQNEKKC
jgi:pantothenate kinase type III